MGDKKNDYLSGGLKDTIAWSDIDKAISFNPVHEEIALGWINASLLYMPKQHIYLPHLPALHSCISYNEAGKLTDEDFFTELTFHLKQIRNDDMKKGGWSQTLVHTKNELDFYESHLIHYKHAARKRLSAFIRYEPSLDHSLEAEMLIRQAFSNDQFGTNAPYCSVDHKAATIVRYREVLLTEGEAAADDSDLMGFAYGEAMLANGIWKNDQE